MINIEQVKKDIGYNPKYPADDMLVGVCEEYNTVETELIELRKKYPDDSDVTFLTDVLCMLRLTLVESSYNRNIGISLEE